MIIVMNNPQHMGRIENINFYRELRLDVIQRQSIQYRGTNLTLISK